jgi:hypothetical protein
MSVEPRVPVFFIFFFFAKTNRTYIVRARNAARRRSIALRKAGARPTDIPFSTEALLCSVSVSIRADSCRSDDQWRDWDIGAPTVRLF